MPLLLRAPRLFALLLAGLCCACGGASASRDAESAGYPPPQSFAGSAPAEPMADLESSAEGEAAPTPPDFRVAQNQTPARGAPPEAPPDDAVTDAPTTGEPAASPPAQPTERQTKLIYRARIHLAIFETARVQDTIEKLAKDMGGYLVRRTKQLIEVRVPAQHFDEVLAQIGKQGDVLDRDVTVQDVTEAFLDAEVRLKNARAMRDRLERLLARANSVQEALQVERELGRITGEIELLEGRLKLLRELVAFSTITVQLSPPPSENVESVVELPFDWLSELGLGNLLRLR